MGSYPFVYWAQNAQEVSLTVDLRDSSDVQVNVQENEFHFEGIGSGAQGRKHYSFSLQLFDKVQLLKVPEEGGSSLQYILKKENSKWWPSVSKDQKRISWLRVDFDRFKDPDESEGSFELVEPVKESYDERMNDLTEMILKDVKMKSKSGASGFLSDLRETLKGLITCYLVGYNIFMFIIHAFLFVNLLGNYIVSGPEFLKLFWSQNSHMIRFATRLQLLDVVHSLAGITKTGACASLTQVSGRLTMVEVIDGYVPLHFKTSTFCLMVVYLLIEMFRYPYYAVSCFKKEYKLTTWLRYNMWMPLYPTGFTLEAITLYKAIPFYYYSGKYSVAMPNAANMSFNFGVGLSGLLLSLPMVAGYLIYYMFRQRRKKFVSLRKKGQ